VPIQSYLPRARGDLARVLALAEENTKVFKRGAGLSVGWIITSYRLPDFDSAAVHSDFGYVQLSDNRDGFGNPLRGLPFINTDASVGKVFPIRDRAKLKISADCFNLFNNVTFANPTMPLVGSTTSTFGVITNTSVPANRQASSRWIMLGGRIEF
jgi:hypothetical protein